MGAAELVLASMGQLLDQLHLRQRSEQICRRETGAGVVMKKVRRWRWRDACEARGDAFVEKVQVGDGADAG